jgi:hypothetical protein
MNIKRVTSVLIKLVDRIWAVLLIVVSITGDTTAASASNAGAAFFFN